MEKTLPAVIDVDKDKCISCHSCISNCPVKFCNDASGDYVSINHNLCIGCGNCIKHCPHGARSGIDDFEVFLSDVGKYPFIAIVAPAAAANFGDVHRLNGYLRSIGVAAFFDVSFGAELTIKSYLTHVKENSPKAVISQPCPAIVSYIEIFRPGLIKHLAPADSPMLHTIKMVREYYPNYASSKIVMISPCYAKKREFEATCDFGEIYNVTMKSLGKHFDENAIDVESFPSVDFENPPAERGVMFSTPGGLLETAKRDFPGIENLTRKIEGSENIYPYLDSLESAIDAGVAPLVIDCLNCSKGCNQGAGTIPHSLTLDHVDYLVSKRKSMMIEKYSPKKNDKSSAAVNKVLEKYWKKGLYSRQYQNLSSNLFVTRPDDDELKKIFASLNKFSGKDIFDCTSCGYNKCEKMAFAIHNGLNKPDNCYHFKESQLHDKEEMSAMLDKLKDKNKSFRELSSAFEMMLSGFEKHMAAVELSVEKTSETMKFIISANDNVHSIINMVNEISFHTNILSLNAAIEAARAGNAGKSFAVVAGEVRSLSLKSTDSADDIRKILNSNTEIIKNGSENVDEIIRNFKMIQDSINSFSDIIKKMNECFSER